MKPRAVIEIVSTPDGKPPTDLLRTAYRASAGGMVILALRDVGPGTVDDVLDGLVHDIPLDIPGVRYISVGDVQALLDAASEAEAIYFATAAFRALMAKAHIEMVKMRPVDSVCPSMFAVMVAEERQ